MTGSNKENAPLLGHILRLHPETTVVIGTVCTAYRPKALKFQAFQSCGGTCFANIWQKAKSYHLPWEPSNTTRAHVQARIWGQATVYQQELLDPLENGYHMDSNGQLKPKTTDVLPASDAIVEMVRCQCQ